MIGCGYIQALSPRTLPHLPNKTPHSQSVTVRDEVSRSKSYEEKITAMRRLSYWEGVVEVQPWAIEEKNQLMAWEALQKAFNFVIEEDLTRDSQPPGRREGENFSKETSWPAYPLRNLGRFSAGRNEYSKSNRMLLWLLWFGPPTVNHRGLDGKQFRKRNWHGLGIEDSIRLSIRVTQQNGENERMKCVP